MDYNLHEEVGEGAVVCGRGERGGEVLQPRGLEPPGHDGVPDVPRRSRAPRPRRRRRVVVVVQSRRGRRGIALLHLPTHVALRPALGRQLSQP